MNPDQLEIGDTVSESPMGAGTITDFTERGFPRVNDVAVAWLKRTDGAVFDPFGSLKPEWWVYSTALSKGWLMVECKKTHATGTVRDPSPEEWKAAFYAPSHPYRWYDESRVVVYKDKP